MIRLHKGDEPAVLKQNGVSWLGELKAKIIAKVEPSTYLKSRYRHPDIKATLCKETGGKCAYCESKLLHVAYGDVEHIHPKSDDINLTYIWSNLTLACDVCNTNKGSAKRLLDPYKTDPATVFKFIGPMVIAEPTSAIARNTEKRLQLNRVELVERRMERIRSISNQIVLICNSTDPEERQTLIDDLNTNDSADDSEFAAFVRSFVQIMLPSALSTR